MSAESYIINYINEPEELIINVLLILLLLLLILSIVLFIYVRSINKKDKLK
ncbi:MAG: hypothetical protein V4538_13805 [Bacteroidota bacterium]